MNLNDLYEMRDRRDAYQRDVDNSTSGFGKDSQAYRADGGANDENHALDQQSSTWYIRLNGKLIKDKSGNPYSFQDKAAANKAALTMQAKLFNKDKEFMLTTNPNDKPQGVAEAAVPGVPGVPAAPGIPGVAKAAPSVAPVKKGGTLPMTKKVLTPDQIKQYNAKQAAARQATAAPAPQAAAPTAPAAPKAPKAPWDPATGQGAKYDGVTGEPTPAWQKELERQEAARLEKVEANRIASQADAAERDARNAELVRQGMRQNPSNVTNYITQPPTANTSTAPGNVKIANGDPAQVKTAMQAKIAAMQAKNPKLAAAMQAEIDALGESQQLNVQQRAQLMKQNYGQLPEEEKEKDRVVARALLQALKGDQGVKEGYVPINSYSGPSDNSTGRGMDYARGLPKSNGIGSRLLNKAKEKINTMKGLDPSGRKLPSYEWNSKDNIKNLPPELYWQDQYEKVTNYDIPQAQNVSKNKLDTDYYVKHATKIKELLASYGIEVPDIENRSAILNREPVRLQQGVSEGDVDSDGYSVDHADSGEYDYEGDQAKDQLNTIVRAARRLNGMLDDNENMPEWVQMKITNAADYIDTAADYIESNQEPELAEGERGRGRPPSGQQDTTPVTPGRVEKTATGIRHHADASRYGGTEPDAEDDHLMSKSHISRLGKMTEPDIDEGEKVGNMDADKFDAAMSRLKQLAGAGPMKTVYDPTKRVYRNVPTAVQPKK
jgi:hypothetical protein